MEYRDILQSNLKSDCVLRSESIQIDLPMPENGLTGTLYVAKNLLGDALVFGKKHKDNKLEITSIFRVKGKDDNEKLELIRSDDPQERSISFVGVESFRGNVLVVGAGIGVVQGFLALNKNVTSVTTVEEETDVCELVKGLYPFQQFIAKDYYEFFHENQESFDCIYIHPWNSFHYELIPYLNTLVAASISKCPEGQVPQVSVWGYGHTVNEYTKACLTLLRKAKSNINTIKLGFDKTSALKRSSPLMASCIEFLREEYVKTKTGKWAPKTERIIKLALETALTSSAR